MNFPKTAGIVADNFKLDTFKKELTAKGFTFTVHPFTTDGVSQIHVTVKTSADVMKIKQICEKVELLFKRRN